MRLFAVAPLLFLSKIGHHSSTIFFHDHCGWNHMTKSFGSTLCIGKSCGSKCKGIMPLILGTPVSLLFCITQNHDWEEMKPVIDKRDTWDFAWVTWDPKLKRTGSRRFSLPWRVRKCAAWSKLTIKPKTFAIRITGYGMTGAGTCAMFDVRTTRAGFTITDV